MAGRPRSDELKAIAHALEQVEKAAEELHSLVSKAFQGDCEAEDRLKGLLDRGHHNGLG